MATSKENGIQPLENTNHRPLDRQQDRQIDGQKDSFIDIQIDRQTPRQKIGRKTLVEKTGVQPLENTNHRPLDRKIDRQKDRQIARRIDRQIDRRIDKHQDKNYMDGYQQRKWNLATRKHQSQEPRQIGRKIVRSPGAVCSCLRHLRPFLLYQSKKYIWGGGITLPGV